MTTNRNFVGSSVAVKSEGGLDGIKRRYGSPYTTLTMPELTVVTSLT